MGFIAHRLDNTLLIRASLLIAALGTLLLWQSGSSALNLLGLAAIGFACAPIYPTLINETHRRVEMRYRANAIGFEMAAAGLGQSLYPGLIALVAQHSSLGVIAPMLFVGALVAIAIHETAARRKTQAVAAPAA
jgi:fucose permease